MNVTDKILDNLIKVVIGAFVVLCTACWKFVPLENISKELIIIVAAFFILTTLVLVAWIIEIKYKKNQELNLELKYGVYWDKKLNPYCPACQKPLSLVRIKATGRTKLKCKQCDKQVSPHDGDNILTFSEARSRLST